MRFLLVNFAVKNAMFNLNENNRIVMSQHPCDMRIGVDGMVTPYIPAPAFSF